MGKNGIEAVYLRTCTTYNKEPINEQADAWLKVLGEYPVEAVCRAVERWECDPTEETFTGRPKGSRMPSPAEIKALVIFEEKRLENEKRFRPCGKCESGWIREMHGRTEGGNPVDEKMGAMRPCQCRLDWIQARKENMGIASEKVSEDFRRKLSGEMSFGEGDVLALWKMAEKRERQLGKKLTQSEYRDLLEELIQKKRKVS